MSVLGGLRGLSVAAATSSVEDWLLVAYAAVLSRATSYQVNVLRWVRRVFWGAESFEEIVERALGAPGVVASYQARVLAGVAEQVAEAVASGAGLGPCGLRERLLAVRGLGPKTANAVVLFTGLSTQCPPPDTHLARFVAERLAGPGAVRGPVKEWCLEAGGTCSSCPYASRCPAGIVASLFRGAAGLVQTAAYTYYSLRGRGLLEVLRRYYALPRGMGGL